MSNRRKISLGHATISPVKKPRRPKDPVITLDLPSRRKELLRKKVAAFLQADSAHTTPSGPAPSTPTRPQIASSSAQTIQDDTSGSLLIIDGDHAHITPVTTPSTPTSNRRLETLHDQTLPFPDDNDIQTLFPSNPTTPQSKKLKTPRKRAPRVPKKVKTAAEEAAGTVENWQKLLSTLTDTYLQYKDHNVGKFPEEIGVPVHECNGGCIVLDNEVHVYYADHHRMKTFQSCSCQSLAQTLVLHGFFPTSPSRHRMAIAFSLLELYQGLCRHSSDAVTSLAAALETTYKHRGFRLLDSNGKTPTDPLRRALGHSLEWYDVFVNDIHRSLDNQLETLKTQLPRPNDTISSITVPLAHSPVRSMIPSRARTATSSSDNAEANPTSHESKQTPNEEETEEETLLMPGRCSGYLQRLCPACFGGDFFGESFQRGGDIHVALDGNFHHRHLKSGGDGVKFYDSYRFLDKSYVDGVGARIEEVRKRPPKAYNSPVPDDVVDADRDSYKAAKGDREQASSKRFDENGMMALVCRHDIPLLTASIDTPGEQQKYAVALLEDFFHQIPEQALVVALYDIGCVLDRSLNIRERRIWLLDRQCDAIAEDHRRALGTTIQRKLIKFVQKKEAEAVRQLRSSGLPAEELRELWAEQKIVQSSAHSLAPARLKKELEKVLKLQAEIEQLQASIDATRLAIKKMRFPPSDALFLLAELERNHTALKKKADQLYDSLNIPQNHPRLAKVPLEYLHTLLLARDTKIAIRTKAIGAFQEYAQIDQAVGGAQEALGTKAHQQTRKAITKRTPALENLIKKYNQYCAYLETSYKPDYQLPVPKPLPTKISVLRDADISHLWEDVWVSSSSPPPRWLTDDTVRKGIRALLTLDRCAEERLRLVKEAKNLCGWFREELHALLALSRDHSVGKYRTLIKLRLQDHLLLADEWGTSFIGKEVFEAQVIAVRQELQVPQQAEVRRPELAFRASPLFQEPSPHDPDVDEDVDGRLYMGDDMAAADEMNEPVEPMDEPRELLESDEEGFEVEVPDFPNLSEEALALADLQASDSENSDDEDSDGQLRLQWQLPDKLGIDCTVATAIKSWQFGTLEGGWWSFRMVRSTTTPRQRHKFTARELNILAEPRARLNEDCLNGSALLLRETFGDRNSNCAVLSTFVIPELLRTSSWTDCAWRVSLPSEYWSKSTWLVPIHSRTMEHWALAIAKGDTRELLLFDSFASKDFLTEWLPKVQVTVSQLVLMAKEHGHPVGESFECLSEWTARPLQLSAVQSNGYDCGLWALWVMIAVFRGFDYAHLQEKDMPRFRKFLARLIRNLPVSS
ncbi:hypothetical protein AAF712_011096 [Marasmius tenuissimus]|uniref:Ubiquitin-like protease family profile domain-containing protein n=1 Tax=Marasmius tenuissimus TaxID=585030 RepID=A0ABR2ZKW4_9AGAR